MIKNKKSQSHLEILLSFVIFIGFLIFLLIFFNPFKKMGNEQTYLNLLQQSIEKELKKEIIIYSIKLNESYEGCYNFEIKDDDNLRNKNLTKKDLNNTIYDSMHTIKENNYVIYSNFSSQIDFYYIYFSEDFLENNLDGNNCNRKIDKKNYTLGMLRSYYSISFKYLNETFKKEYETNYSKLKDRIGLPQTKNFAIDFYNLERTNKIISLGNTPEKAVVYSRTIPEQIFYPNGTFEYIFMQIKVW
ncbi:MAG: hypothetical protein QW117_02150 [Candidatus Pacearchaeota archaeon]